MIRICSINLKEENNDTKISYNVRTDKLTETNFTIIGLMLDEKNNEVISKVNQSAEQVQINANKISLKRKRNCFNK